MCTLISATDSLRRIPLDNKRCDYQMFVPVITKTLESQHRRLKGYL